MRIIKLGIISIIFFSLLLTGISLFFPSHVRISKAIDIQTEKDSLLAQLSNVVNWKNWYPGADTSELVMIEGIPKGMVTADKKWLMIRSISDSAVILGKHIGPDTGILLSGWNIFPGRNPNSYTVQWYMDFHLRWYPWEKFSSLLLEKRYGTMMEQGLTNLKARLEK